ncbi:MAG: GreA/GreB family elongation factor [Planctomycetota bacterium]|nr:GreA/GreB family elongation factor [Planctomycetota bacterium]
MPEEPQVDRTVPLVKLVREKRFDDLEAEWMAVVEDEAWDLDALRVVLQELVDQGATKALESLLWLLLSSWKDRKGVEPTLDAARRVADLLPESDVLREELAGVYRAAFGGVPSIATLAEMALPRRDIPLRVAVQRLEKLLLLEPGTYVSDSRRRSPGRVIGVDEARKVLSVSFGDTQRAYDAASVENLEIGEQDDLAAILLFDKPRVERLAAEDPAELARLVLKAYGPHMGFRDFRSALAEVVPAGAWSRWWSGAKTRVRRSPLIEMSDGAEPTFFLRATPRAFEDRSREEFDETPPGQARLVLVLGHLKETGHDPSAEMALARHFADELSPESILTPEADVAALLRPIAADGLARCVLALVRDAMPERWPDLYAAALMGCSESVCEWIAEQLAGAGHEDSLAGAAATILKRPDENVPAILWLWQAATSGRHPQALAGVDRASLTIRFFLAADGLAGRAADDRSLRSLVSQIRSTAAARDGALLRSVLEASDDRQAKDIRAAIERNAALTDVIRTRLLDIVRKTHPSHFVVKTVPPWEEDVIYTTPAALHKQEEVYGDLVTKKVLDNQRAIASAAEHGDISENAEFTAALEERERLAERAARLQADIAKARPITPSMASGDTVTVGSRLRARRVATGEEEIFVFLGPWDTDIAKHIYYYRAPLALAFMGRRVGDTVAFGTGADERKWEILEAGPGI